MTTETQSEELKVWDIEGNDLTQLAPLHICAVHNKDEWQRGEYVDNHDGTVSCKFCPWGTALPGYMRLIDGKLIDLRSPTGDRA